MNLAELNKVAEAMVAPGRGILAADKSTSTIKKRFDAIGVESTPISRRDYREMLFRSNDAMTKNISGVILYDETIRQNAKDGTPLVQIIEKAGALPGIKVDKGTKPLPFAPNEVITEGLDGLRDRLIEYRGLGAKFAKWRAVIDIGPGIPSFGCVAANANALARYAALCEEQEIVPIVEPEVLMDGNHDIDRCSMVTEWVLKTVFEQLFYSTRAARRHGAETEHGGARQEIAEAGVGRRSGGEDRAHPQSVRAGGRARHCVLVGRAVGRRSNRPSRRHQQTRPAAVACDILLRPRAASRAAEGVVRQTRKRRRGATRLRPSRPDERPRRARPLDRRAGEESGVSHERGGDRAKRGGPVVCGERDEVSATRGSTHQAKSIVELLSETWKTVLVEHPARLTADHSHKLSGRSDGKARYGRLKFDARRESGSKS